MRGKPSPSQLAQTTPPAAPEKAVRWSVSPQRAQLASSGEKPAASASFSRKARAGPGLAGRRRVGVEQRQVVAEQVVGGLVRLALVEQAQHRVAPAPGGHQRPAVRPQPPVARQPSRRRSPSPAPPGPRRGPGRAGRTAPAAPEPRLRPPRPLRDRPDPPPRRGVEMQDPIGLAVADAAQHHRLGLERSGHEPSESAGPPGRDLGEPAWRTASRIAAAVAVAAAAPICIAAKGRGSPPEPEARQKATSPSTGVKVGSTARAMPAVAARATMPHSRLSRVASVQTQTSVVLPSGALRSDAWGSGPPPGRSGPRRPLTISPSASRAPTRIEPSSAITSPAALTAASAATVSPAPVRSAA